MWHACSDAAFICVFLLSTVGCWRGTASRCFQCCSETLAVCWLLVFAAFVANVDVFFRQCIHHRADHSVGLLTFGHTAEQGTTKLRGSTYLEWHHLYWAVRVAIFSQRCPARYCLVHNDCDSLVWHCWIASRAISHRVQVTLHNRSFQPSTSCRPLDSITTSSQRSL